MAGAGSAAPEYLTVNAEAAVTSIKDAVSGSSSGVGGAAALAEIGRRYGAEMSEAGLRLRGRVESGLGAVQARAESLRVEAEASLKELRSTLEDLSPLPAERLSKRDVLESLSEGAAVLKAGFAGAFVGRVLGDVLGLFIPVPLALVSALLLLPAAFGVCGARLAGAERRLALLETGALMGLAFGVGTRGLPALAYLPPLAALVPALVLGLGGAKLSSLGDRRAVLGAVVGVGVVLELLASLVLGGLSFAGLLLALLAGGVAAVQVQISLGGSGKLVGLSPVLGLALVLVANAALMATLVSGPPNATHNSNDHINSN